MAKPTLRFVGGLLRLQLSHVGNPSKPSSPSAGAFSRISSSYIRDALNPSSHPVSVTLTRSYFSNGFVKGSVSESQLHLGFQQILPKSTFSNLGAPACSKGVKPFSSASFAFASRDHIQFREVGSASLRPRQFSSGLRASHKGKISANYAQKALDKPVSAVKSALGRYQEAIGLQVDAFWKRNSLILVGAGGILVCAFLWRIMFGIASTFVGLSEGMAKYGFLALSASMVAFGGLYVRSRFAINPDRVYRIAMRKLNTSAGILEVMGAPLSGTDLRAYVMSGGGLTLKKFRPTLRSKRCFLIFPIRGSERKGLVSVEVRKKKGQYDMKLLAVDIPMATGQDQRLFLIGDEEEYRVGGGLISELRDPVVKAMAATKEFEDRDEIEDEQDAERELEEAERKHQEEMEALERDR